MAHHGNFRNLLHRNRLEEFKAWVEADTRFKVHPPSTHAYEVFRMSIYAYEGDNPHMVFYLRDRGDHVSIPEMSTVYVREFLETHPSYFKKKNKNKARRKRFKTEETVHGMQKRIRLTVLPPTKDQIAAVTEEVDAMDLPDGAYWALVHEKLGLEYGDVFDLMEQYGMLVPTTSEEQR